MEYLFIYLFVLQVYEGIESRAVGACLEHAATRGVLNVGHNLTGCGIGLEHIEGVEAASKARIRERRLL